MITISTANTCHLHMQAHGIKTLISDNFKQQGTENVLKPHIEKAFIMR